MLCVQQLSAQSIKMPVISATSLQPAQSGQDISKALDGTISTHYNSKWGQLGIPDQLNFYFSDRVKSINKLIYRPRRDSGYEKAGVWTKIKISYSTQDNPDVFNIILPSVSLIMDRTDKIIDLPYDVLQPAVIRIDVSEAYKNASTCGEMEFYSSEEVGAEETAVNCILPLPSLDFVDTKVYPDVSGSSASSTIKGYGIGRSLDGDFDKSYHSQIISDGIPIVLTYKFDGNTSVDYLKYYPRNANNRNGDFGNIKISYNTITNPNYTTIVLANLRQKNLISTLKFPSRVVPLNIKVEVLDGRSKYAVVGEMEFYKKHPNSLVYSDYSNIFQDELFGSLKSNVIQQDIDAISVPFLKELAQCIFNNTYNKKYRVRAYHPYATPNFIKNSLKIGNYNEFENATGIFFEKDSTIVVFAKNVSYVNKAYLRIKDFANEDSPTDVFYDLHNGINIIKTTNKGLGYIHYFTDAAGVEPVELNITGGLINGYYTREANDQEWQEMLMNNVYPKIDIEGIYTKLIMNKDLIKKYHFESAQLLIDKYDVMEKSEREMMGFFKFNRNVKNRQFINIDSKSGWYAGNEGVHLSDTGSDGPKVADSKQLSLWGIAHELGHINQVRPGIKWAGMAEITNNIYSMWAAYHLEAPVNNRKIPFLDKSLGTKTYFPKVAGNMYGEFLIQTQIQNKSYFEQMRKDISDVDRSDNLFRMLVPYWQLMLYYQLAGAAKGAETLDFDEDMSDEDSVGSIVHTPTNTVDYAHWFATVVDKVIQTNESQLSNGEIVMNLVKNICDAVQEDLTDFFSNTGFLVPLATQVRDYGDPKDLIITQAMIDEAKAYIADKGYPKPVSPVVNYISASSIEIFKNKAVLSGVTGQGAQTMENSAGTFLLVDNSKWKNAVAFETFDGQNKLISVSVAGTGDLTFANTYVDFPSNAVKVFAVGYDGQKILVYPNGTLLNKEINKEQSKIHFYPNPLKDGENIKIVISDANNNDLYIAVLHDIKGNLLLSTKGNISEITQYINTKINVMTFGSYILTLDNGKERYDVKILKK